MSLVFNPNHLHVVAHPFDENKVDLIYEPDNEVPRLNTHVPFELPKLSQISQENDQERKIEKLLIKPPKLDLKTIPSDLTSLLKTNICGLCTDIEIVRDLATGIFQGVRQVVPENVQRTEVNFEDLIKRPQHFANEIDFDFLDNVKENYVGDSNSNILKPFNTDKLDLQELFGSLPSIEEIATESSQDNSSEKTDVVDIGDLGKDTVDKLPEVDLNNVLSISEVTTQHTKRKWADVVDISVPVPNYDELNPNKAIDWPFELDTFQKKAILLMERGENVFVAAHTSAGKTVVAEYAIALSRKHMTKAVYTSPIKTLSNEKFRDFRETFDDVGIITGDVQINREAATLIMTTEILRSMLYNKASIIDDLEWVIFDECHYINDADRGVVWEEVLIMLPSHVNLVLLSATVPNALDLADWIGRIKQKKINVICTMKRPVPLEHYLYLGKVGASKEQKQMNKGKNLPEPVKLPEQHLLILDAQGNFISRNYLLACESKKSQNVFKRPPDDKTRYLQLVQFLQKNDATPAIVFTLSRKRCDTNANALVQVDMTTGSEKSAIHNFIKQCTARLSPTDRKLPQVQNLTTLLKNGIGIHHSGILPIMKEVVEMLFQRGLTKLLFATETFAMGVNMPARTVVFDSIRKYDGYQFRDLIPAEYIQMAGRAGRRGKDTVGTVLIMAKGDIPDSSALQVMMMGKPQYLESKFKVTDTMILNLKAGLQRRVEDMMKDSFCENANQSQIGKMAEKKQELVNKLENFDDLRCDSCKDIESCLSILSELSVIRKQFWTKAFEYASTSRLFAVGRVVIFCRDGETPRLGVVAGFNSKQNLLSVVSLATKMSGKCFWPAYMTIQKSQESKCELLNITGEEILDALADEVKIDSKAVSTPKGLRECAQIIFDKVEQWSSKYKKLPLTKEVKGADWDFIELLNKVTAMESEIARHSCAKCPLFESHSEVARKQVNLQGELDAINLALSEDGMRMMPDYFKHLAVLERLGFIEPNGPLKLKGRIARTMSEHEVLLTELLVCDILYKCKPPELAALLSVFVYQGKSDENETAEIPEQLQEIMDSFLQLALHVGTVRKECGFEEDPICYQEQFNRGLVKVVFNWAMGVNFAQIMEIASEQQEGTVVRCIQRLDELLGHVKDAAKVIGNPDLHKKVETASNLIRRDIVFAASLYLN